MIIDKEELEAPVHVCLESGLFRYAFEVDHADSGYPSIMTVKNGKFSGFSRAAFDLAIQEKPAGCHKTDSFSGGFRGVCRTSATLIDKSPGLPYPCCASGQ